MSDYIRCTRCVMDTTDPTITFDSEGVCSHCHGFDNVTSKEWFPNADGEKRLAKTVEQIKIDGKGDDYDCIIGLSGGVDSSYLALKVAQWGLRPLVVHVDAGWNSELAISNIEKIVKKYNFDLHTHVVDWEIMQDLQVAYLKSGLSNLDVPQDHVFFSSLYHFATKNGIKYILSGGNIATEGIFPVAWHGGSAMDAINLKSVHKKFGKKPLRNYNTISFLQYYLWYPFFKKMRTVRPLNFMPYSKEEAIAELKQQISWRAYGRKHGESLFTKVFQNDFLPRKFGYDKRLPHLSSLIMSNQMTREKALAELKMPLYDSLEQNEDLDYFCKKLQITRGQYEEFINGPSTEYSSFPNWVKYHKILKYVQVRLEKLIGKRLNIYS